MSDSLKSNFCHNCGDPVDESTIYCDSCSSGDTEVSMDDTKSESEKTWDDVKETHSGTLAVSVLVGIMGSIALLFLGIGFAFINQVAFGATDTLFWPMIVVVFVLLAISFILSETWTAFKLLVTE